MNEADDQIRTLTAERDAAHSRIVQEEAINDVLRLDRSAYSAAVDGATASAAAFYAACGEVEGLRLELATAQEILASYKRWVADHWHEDTAKRMDSAVRERKESERLRKRLAEAEETIANLVMNGDELNLYTVGLRAELDLVRLINKDQETTLVGNDHASDLTAETPENDPESPSSSPDIVEFPLTASDNSEKTENDTGSSSSSADVVEFPLTTATDSEKTTEETENDTDSSTSSAEIVEFPLKTEITTEETENNDTDSSSFSFISDQGHSDDK